MKEIKEVILNRLAGEREDMERAMPPTFSVFESVEPPRMNSMPWLAHNGIMNNTQHDLEDEGSC